MQLLRISPWSPSENSRALCKRAQSSHERPGAGVKMKSGHGNLLELTELVEDDLAREPYARYSNISLTKT